MKIYAVVYTADSYDTDFEDRFMGVYLTREDADDKLSQIIAPFELDEAAYEYRERKVRELARDWIQNSGVFDVHITFADLQRYGDVSSLIAKIASLDPNNLQNDYYRSKDIIREVKWIKTRLELENPLPAWPEEFEWQAPDGGEDDYRVIELEAF